MAHFDYVKPGGVWPLLSLLTSSIMQTIDGMLYKTINGDNGGTWAPDTTAITIGGLGLDVTGPFSASAAGNITITSGNTLTIASGATLSMQGTQNITSTGTFYVKSGGDIVIESGGTLTAQSGSTLAFNSGSSFTMAGTTTVAGTSILTANSGAAFTFANGSTTSVAGSFTVTNAGTFTVNCNATFGGNASITGVFNANGNANFAYGQTVTLSGVTTFGSGVGSIATFEGPAAFKGTMTIDATVTKTDASTTTRTGSVVLSGDEAVTGYRLASLPIVTDTIDPTTADFWNMIIEPVANYTVSFIAPAGAEKAKVTVRRRCSGVVGGNFTIKDDATGFNLVKFEAGTNQIGWGMFIWSGSRWEVEAYGGNVTAYAD